MTPRAAAEDAARRAGLPAGGAVMCTCGHLLADHDATGRCQEWWRYPDVLHARQCGCEHAHRHGGGGDYWSRLVA